MTTSRTAPRLTWQQWFDRVPLFVILCGIASVAMFVPAIFGAWAGDFDSARPFLYGGIVFSGVTACVAFAGSTLPEANRTRGLLLSLVGAYLVLPAFLAVPVFEVLPSLSFHNAYFEMVSSFTTTGATVFDLPDRIPDTIHLWRALVGWLGGLLMWVAAIAILAPLRLGGFEVVLTGAQVGRDTTLGRSAASRFPMRRLLRHFFDLAPIYLGLTGLLWLLLLIAGEDPFIAICHAMSTLATSGISPVATLQDAKSGFAGELLIFLFLGFAISRSTFASDMPVPLTRRWYQDPEIRLAAILLCTVPFVIYAHHWLALIEAGGGYTLTEKFLAFWGTLFSTLSFMTTSGFISGDWQIAENWSGLSTPGLFLIGLSLVGGGVATTAGGVKLLRVYAIYKHGELEAGRLVHPSMVVSPGHPARRIKWESAYIAWLFFMIYALSTAGIMVALSLFRIDFETGIILTVAALSNTGPLTVIAGSTPIAVALLDAPAQWILAIAMVLGRLETLAIVALLNPTFWRS